MVSCDCLIEAFRNLRRTRARKNAGVENCAPQGPRSRERGDLHGVRRLRLHDKPPFFA